VLRRFARRYRRLALALSALALVSLGVAPFTHGAATTLAAGGTQDYCAAAAPGESPARGPSPAGGHAPPCPVCVAFSASDTLSPPAAATVLPALALARAPNLRPPATPFVADPSALTPPSHAPPTRG
jgi:dienelactone hydrolase